jgi:hypothetical protein
MAWREVLAFASVVAGMVAMASALVPLCGLPLGLAGLVIGVIGLRSRLHDPAMFGVLMSWLALVLAGGLFVAGWWPSVVVWGIWGGGLAICWMLYRTLNRPIV